jgi:hypothetical protein
MRRIATAFLLGLLAAALLSGLQSALSLHLGGGRVPLSLPVVLLAWAALEAELLEGCAGALAVGYVMDVFAGTPKGLLTFLAVLAFQASRLARSSLAVHGPVGFAALVGGATSLVGAGAILLTRLTAAPEARPGAGLLWRVLAEAAVGALAALPLHPLLARGQRLLAREPEPGLQGHR